MKNYVGIGQDVAMNSLVVCVIEYKIVALC